MAEDIKRMGNGPWKEASDEDVAKDEKGFTMPNLHRRLDPQQPTSSYEVAPREYQIGVYEKDSYRTTKINTHDEESEYDEIP